MQPETTLERPICVPQPVLARRDRPPGYAEQGRRRQKGRRAATPATGRRIHAQKPSREAVRGGQILEKSILTSTSGLEREFSTSAVTAPMREVAPTSSAKQRRGTSGSQRDGAHRREVAPRAAPPLPQHHGYWVAHGRGRGRLRRAFEAPGPHCAAPCGANTKSSWR